jgi:hypothetical protein
MLLRTARKIPIWGILLLAGLAAAGGFLYASSRVQGPGFPLDDAWIHLTYARNLGLHGEWAFVPGKPSGGSTAPLWTGLLALGFILRMPEIGWAFGLGTLSLIGLAWIGERYFRRQVGVEGAGWLPWAGLFLAGEYHLVWAAASGMETVLMGLFYLLVLYRLGRPGCRWEATGALIGLAVWVRPDGITLLGPAVLVLALSGKSWTERGLSLLRLAGGFALFFLPYLFFNLRIQGSLWPNTFYAKQAEYAALQGRPLALRVLDELSLPLIGAGMLLLPGFVYVIWRALAEKRWSVLAAGLWFLGYCGLYAWRLPVTYQYGRYVIPAMPVYFVLGLSGLALLFQTWRQAKTGRLFTFAAQVTVLGVWLGFYFLGAANYARDVAIIETEMVAAAKWVAANSSVGDVVAAHDIGALGYYGQRDILDLAGLVTPEVIPFIRDESRLAEFLDQRGAAVLVTFPGWYEELTRGRERLYTTGGAYAPAAGGENLSIYRWK